MATVQERVIGAMRLQASTFEEVEHDTTATAQAAMVVAAVGVANGLAALLYGSVTGFVLAVVVQLVGWVIGSALLLLVGTRLFPGKNTEADLGQVLRTVGFAESAGLLGVFGVVPYLGWVFTGVAMVWILIAMVIAVRQALDYDDTTKAVVVCVVAWLIMLVIQVAAAFVGIGAAVVGGGMS